MDPVPEARRLLRIFQEESVSGLIDRVDDVLVFLIALRDGYEIRRSNSPRFSGRSFHLLDTFIHELESHPAAALESDEQRLMLQLILEDIVTGRVLLRRILSQ